MKTLGYLIVRNTKLFFKDKGTFFSAMIAPLILLVLYVLFLNGIFVDSFESAVPEGLDVPNKLINGFVGGWEVSSLLAVCCVTIAFIANMIMVQDKVNGAISDITIAPVKSHILSLSYYISTVVITCLVCYIATAVGLIYLSVTGWYLSVGDVFLVILDVFVTSMFGTACSSIVCYFLKSQGGMSAVGTIVSAVYGFICGAYYPVSQFSVGIQNVVTCLPGTYCTTLFRKHLIGGVMDELGNGYFPKEVVDAIEYNFDINIEFFGTEVSQGACYAIAAGTIVLFIGIFVLISYLGTKKLKSKHKK